ncbi:hypothetical protein CW452_23770 [Salmonella enterica subsp. enterica serovar Enteritidis]|nr:hypothetical protein [Salmonella enterica subsp. enterica serovar Enteritidis]EDM9662395.1 hypothetical protein [Salmonella enterica subsp. enterica serovar Enteritidis]
MVFIIDDKTISDIIRNHEHTNHAGYYFYLSVHYQMERAGWMKKGCFHGTVAKLAMRQPFVLFKGLTFQKLCLPGAFRPGDHHNKMLRPGLCVVHASPQYL